MISFRRWSWVLVVPVIFVASAAVVRAVYLRRDFQREIGQDLREPLQMTRLEIDTWRDQSIARARIAADLLATQRERGSFATQNDSMRGSFARVARAVTLQDSATLWAITPMGALLASYGPDSKLLVPNDIDSLASMTTTHCGNSYCAEVRAPLRDGSRTAATVVMRMPITDRTFPRLDPSQNIPNTRVSILIHRGDSVIVIATAAHDTTPLRSRSFSWDSVPPHVRKAFSAATTEGTADNGLNPEGVLYATVRYPDLGWVVLREMGGVELVERLLAPIAIEILFVSALFLFAFGFVRSRVRLAAMRGEQELAEIRSDFVAAVSHELRTPLAQIRLFAELLRKGSMRLPEERQRALNVIEKEAGRLSILVDNVLNYARLHRKVKSRFESEVPAITDVTRDVEYAVEACAPLAAEKGAYVVSTVDGTRCMAAVDSQSLRQILLNFFENAVKYGPRNQTITIGTSVNRGSVRVFVSDEGPGIPEDERETIWGAFSRGSAARQLPAGGSGIGLSVVRDLVAEYGGRAWVERAPTGGARFLVEFRMAALTQQEIAAQAR